MLLAGLDDGAVDDAAGDRPDLAGHDRGHHLVEQRDAGRDVAAPDQRLALAVASEGDQIAAPAKRSPIAAACSKIAYAAAVRRRTVPRERRGAAGSPALGAVEAVLVDQPLTAGDPAAASSGLAAHDEGHGEPERAAGGPLRVALAEVLVMGLLPGRGAVVVPAGEVRRDRELFEGGTVEAIPGRCESQLVGRGGPRPVREGSHVPGPERWSWWFASSPREWSAHGGPSTASAGPL